MMEDWVENPEIDAWGCKSWRGGKLDKGNNDIPLGGIAKSISPIVVVIFLRK